MTTQTFPVAPDTVTVLGSRWPANSRAWAGLAFSHPLCVVRTTSTLMEWVCGGKDVPNDLHLNVPFEHPDDGPVPDVPDMFYRVRPRAEPGKKWRGRKVMSVAIERDTGRDPPWHIIVEFAR